MDDFSQEGQGLCNLIDSLLGGNKASSSSSSVPAAAAAAAAATETEADTARGAPAAPPSLEPVVQEESIEDLVQGLLQADSNPSSSRAEPAAAQPGPRQPVPHDHLDVRMFGDPAEIACIGNTIQRGLYNKFVFACQKGERKQGPMTQGQVVVQNFVQSSTMKSIAAIAEASQRSIKFITNALQSAACTMLMGASWMLGMNLVAWKNLFAARKFTPLAIIHRFKYDETPLRMRQAEWNKMFHPENAQLDLASEKEEYKFSKILRVDWQIGWLVHDESLKRHHIFTVNVPTALSCMDRNTAECLTASLQRTYSQIPELKSFEDRFPIQIRMPVIDSFRANLKSERYFEHVARCTAPDTTQFVSSVYLCDVHKTSNAIKAATSLQDDTMSGLVNLALSMESAGSTDALRRILADIFEEQLVVVYGTPPPEHEAHRMAVLDSFLPATSMKARRRRFIIQSLLNGNISDAEEVQHYCSFTCCASHQQTLSHFQRYLTQALLPSKMAVLSRKSWTGADRAVEWAGLLQSHHHLLGKVMIRYVGRALPRQPAEVAADTEADASAQQQPLPLDLEIADMDVDQDSMVRLLRVTGY